MQFRKQLNTFFQILNASVYDFSDQTLNIFMLVFTFHVDNHCDSITNSFFLNLTPERLPVSVSIPATTRTSDSIAVATGSLPASYNPVRVRNKENEGNGEDDYLWLSHCQSQLRWSPFRKWSESSFSASTGATVRRRCWLESQNETKTSELALERLKAASALPCLHRANCRLQVNNCVTENIGAFSSWQSSFQGQKKT